jgi:hypothetical protein
MPKRKAGSPSPPTPLKPEVQAELDAIDRAFARVSKTRASAVDFLKRAGIVDKHGRLAKAYR